MVFCGAGLSAQNAVPIHATKNIPASSVIFIRTAFDDYSRKTSLRVSAGSRKSEPDWHCLRLGSARVSLRAVGSTEPEARVGFGVSPKRTLICDRALNFSQAQRVRRLPNLARLLPISSRVVGVSHDAYCESGDDNVLAEFSVSAGKHCALN